MSREKSREFLVSDVVEWVEPIWSPNKSYSKKKKGKASPPWGEQRVVGQINAIEGDYLTFTVLKAEVIKNNIGSDLRPHKVGATVTKKSSTLLRSVKTERLHWSEEDVRNSVLTESTDSEIRAGISRIEQSILDDARKQGAKSTEGIVRSKSGKWTSITEDD